MNSNSVVFTSITVTYDEICYNFINSIRITFWNKKDCFFHFPCDVCALKWSDSSKHFSSANEQLNPVLIKIFKKSFIELYIVSVLRSWGLKTLSLSWLYLSHIFLLFNFFFSWHPEYTLWASTEEEIGTVSYFNLIGRLYVSKV